MGDYTRGTGEDREDGEKRVQGRGRETDARRSRECVRKKHETGIGKSEREVREDGCVCGWCVKT